MMHGIDISNWQQGLDVNRLKDEIDFIICKATEGTSFVDAFCDGWIQQAIELNMPFGFYHFAQNNDPYIEADFFIQNTQGYFNKGIPVLDIEVTIYNWVDYCTKFCTRVHDKTGVWPMIYTSAGMLPNLYEFTLIDECGLWVAGYPCNAKTWTDEAYPPYSLEPWKFAAIWQFTSNLILTGYDGNLDGNIAFMDSRAWAKYANSSAAPKPDDSKKDLAKVAYEVILGKWNNGMERKRKLTNAGYNYTETQAYVNELYSKANKVIHGEYGNGNDRKQKLGKDYEAVQYIVNDILS